MADRVIERTETESPRETMVVHDHDTPRSSNTGVIVAIIILVVLLLLIFGGGSLFGGGGGDTDVETPVNTNIDTPSAPTTGQ